jgi:hypothetical protein
MSHTTRIARRACLAGVLLASTALPSLASGTLGSHVLTNTMIADDPFVADEATLPTFSWLPQPSQGEPAAALSGLGFEFDKRVTDTFGFAINDGYQWLHTSGQKTADGWQNLVVTLKFTPYINDEHEFLVSLGLTRTLARTGANGLNGAALGNADSGSTAPRLYWGKGFGDLPIGWLRPVALTGSIGYQVADTKLKLIPATDQLTPTGFNNGTANQWSGGLAIQYSLLYLQSQVKDFGLPAFVNQLVPIGEVAWSSAASKPNRNATQYLFGIGLAYTDEKYAVGIEALIPGNAQTGSHIGIIAQVHLYFDDLFPTTLGKPMLDW